MSGLGFDEIFFILILMAVFFDAKQIAKALKWLRITRGKLMNLQYDFEEKLDEFTNDVKPNIKSLEHAIEKRVENESQKLIEPDVSFPIEAQKKEMRNKIKGRLTNLTEEDHTLFSQDICKNFLEDDLYKNAEEIAAFCPTQKEPILTSILNTILEDEKELFLPYVISVEDSTMDIAPIQDLQNDLEIGQFGILEPNEIAKNINFVQMPEVFLIPGMVFSESGQRLGRGKAFYDKFLKDFPEAIKVGICFECQLEADIPVEVHDIQMDVIITEKRIIKIKEQI